MVPILFHVGPYGVRTHELFTTLGLVLGGALALVDARRLGRTEARMSWVVAGVLVGGGIGARLGPVVRHLGSHDTASVVGALVQSGKSVVGGLAGAYAGAVVARRMAGIARPTGDVFVRGVALGLAVGRVGCFLTESIGTTTAMPWGLHVSPAAAARIADCPGCVAGAAMHPSMLYEIAFHLIALVALTRLAGRFTVDGDLFKAYLLAYAAFRFCVELVRTNQDVAAGLSATQLILVPSVALVSWSFVRRLRAASPQSVVPVPT